MPEIPSSFPFLGSLELWIHHVGIDSTCGNLHLRPLWMPRKWKPWSRRWRGFEKFWMCKSSTGWQNAAHHVLTPKWWCRTWDKALKVFWKTRCRYFTDCAACCCIALCRFQNRFSRTRCSRNVSSSCQQFVFPPKIPRCKVFSSPCSNVWERPARNSRSCCRCREEDHWG